MLHLKPVWASMSCCEIMARMPAVQEMKHLINPLVLMAGMLRGQFFAYLAGAIGIKVDIFGLKAKFEILNLAAAAVPAGQTPPSRSGLAVLWVAGTLYWED